VVLAIVVGAVAGLAYLASSNYPDCEGGVCVEITLKCHDDRRISAIHFKVVNTSADRKDVTYVNQTTSASGVEDPEISETVPLDAKATTEFDWEVAEGTVRKVRVQVGKQVLATEEVEPQDFCFQQ